MRKFAVGRGRDRDDDDLSNSTLACSRGEVTSAGKVFGLPAVASSYSTFRLMEPFLIFVCVDSQVFPLLNRAIVFGDVHGP